MNPDLQIERARATFDPKDLTHFLFFGQDLTEKKHEIEILAASDPDFQREPITSMSREEAYSEGVRTAALIEMKMQQLGIEQDTVERYFYRNAVFPNCLLPIGLHRTMFIPVLRSQCTEGQYTHWKKRMDRGEVIGTYAQTELGHGTFVRGMETTATYDEKSQEFVLHTPTLTATKWWSGGMGKTCNHIVVMAQLFSQGKCHGVHPFIVQIRDLETHSTLSGLTLGDIGPKLGFSTVDNGFLKFDHYRIPRENMLMRHAQVSPDGTYSRAVSEKVVYGGMLTVRATMLGMLSIYLAQACTIAIRYSCVRRQGLIEQDSGEVQVIDFQTQQEKVLPCLAMAYSLLFTSRNMLNMYAEIKQEMDAGDYSLLEQLHSTSSGLKAYCSWSCLTMMEVCRQACGGHGYLSSAGFSKLFGELSAAVTYEGDNVVMLLQSARLLMKYCERVRKGEKLHGIVSYLNTDLDVKSTLHNDDLSQLVLVCEYRTARLLMDVSRRMNECATKGLDSSVVWNKNSILLKNAALAHCELSCIRSFVEVLHNDDLDLSVRTALLELGKLHIVHCILQHLGDYTSDGYLSLKQAKLLQNVYEDLLLKVRRNAVAFVDAFDIPDGILESDIGRFDGRVYEAMYRSAQNSCLNKTDVHPSFHKYLKPMMNKKKLLSKL